MAVTLETNKLFDTIQKHRVKIAIGVGVAAVAIPKLVECMYPPQTCSTNWLGWESCSPAQTLCTELPQIAIRCLKLTLAAGTAYYGHKIFGSSTRATPASSAVAAPALPAPTNKPTDPHPAPDAVQPKPSTTDPFAEHPLSGPTTNAAPTRSREASGTRPPSQTSDPFAVDVVHVVEKDTRPTLVLTVLPDDVYNVRFDPTTTVGELREEIMRVCQATGGDFHFNGQLLRDDSVTLASLGIKEGSRLSFRRSAPLTSPPTGPANPPTAAERPTDDEKKPAADASRAPEETAVVEVGKREQFQLELEKPDGMKASISIDSNAKVRDLLEEAKRVFKASDCYLQFGTNCLHEQLDATLASFGVQDGSQIRVTVG